MIVTREAEPRSHRTLPAGAHAPGATAPAPHPHHASHSTAYPLPVELPSAGPSTWRRQAIMMLLLTGLYLVLVMLDRAVFKALFVGLEQIERLEEADGYRLFRVMGSLWSWGGIALVIFAHDWGRVGRAPAMSLRRPPASWRFGSLSRGLMVFTAPVLAGLFAEGAK